MLLQPVSTTQSQGAIMYRFHNLYYVKYNRYVNLQSCTDFLVPAFVGHFYQLTTSHEKFVRGIFLAFFFRHAHSHAGDWFREVKGVLFGFDWKDKQSQMKQIQPCTAGNVNNLLRNLFLQRELFSCAIFG